MSVQYTSLSALRADKQRLKRSIQQGVDRLKADASDCFVPRSSFFFDSPFRYVNWLGYAITAYKTFMSIRAVFRFFKKRR